MNCFVTLSNSKTHPFCNPVTVCPVDRVFEEILFSSSDDLKEAREILQRVVSRNLYRFLGEKLIKDPNVRI